MGGVFAPVRNLCRFFDEFAIMVEQSARAWRFLALLALGVAVLAVMDGRFRTDATAQIPLGGSGDGNIMVVPVQTARDSYGLAMVDQAEKTLWIYEITPRGTTTSKLRLLAARSWEYDRLLKEYNTADPRPDQVRELLEKMDSPVRIERNPEEELQDQAQPEDI